MFSFRRELIQLEKDGLKRQLRLQESENSERIIVDGKSVVNLCSNNYLGLAADERLKRAAIEAIKIYGCGSGASRLVSGTMTLHRQLEEKICQFKKAQACLVYNSGYSANLGIISALVGKDDIVFSDKLNHASILDGIILSRAHFKRYAHKDLEVLEAMLEQAKDFSKKLIVTDTVFSMDGDSAPLKELLSCAERHQALLMVDEAHATGVLGEHGRGALEYCGLEDKAHDVVVMGTLSKAFGCFGAYVTGTKDFIDYLINCSRAFIYTTALPPSVIASAIVALDIIQKEPERRIRLHKHAAFMRAGLRNCGFIVGDTPTPIIPVIIKDAALTMKFSARLFEEGIFVQGIRPPTVPQHSSRLRVTVMATHSFKDLERALEAFKKIGKELCLL